nr:hypothetical protein [Tanacetum cinerariifolium]
MNQNQIGRTVFDIDEESDVFYFHKAIEYHEWLLQQEAQPRLTRTPIFRDREDAERRLRADYFEDHRDVIIMGDFNESDTAACGLNDMLNLMYKLKNLKKTIRGWNSMRQSLKIFKIMLKSKLVDVELVIDKGNASEEVIYKRLEIVNSINELEK